MFEDIKKEAAKMYKVKKTKLGVLAREYHRLGFKETRLESTYEILWYIKKGRIGSCRIDARTGRIDFEADIPIKKQLYLIRPLRFRSMIEKVDE